MIRRLRRLRCPGRHGCLPVGEIRFPPDRGHLDRGGSLFGADLYLRAGQPCGVFLVGPGGDSCFHDLDDPGGEQDEPHHESERLGNAHAAADTTPEAALSTRFRLMKNDVGESERRGVGCVLGRL